jgi:hypothetical protein
MARRVLSPNGMSHRVRPNACAVALLGSLSFAAACGGTVSDVNGRNGRLSGAGDASGGSVSESGGSQPSIVPQPGSGGAAWLATGGWFGGPGGLGGTPPAWPSGGTGPGGAYAMGGSSGEAGFPAGGYAGFAIDAGPPGSGGSPIYVPDGTGCGYTFGSAEWRGSCAPTGGCLNLDPATWSPVVLPGWSDAGAPGGASVEAPFCQAPVPGRTYTFAFDANFEDSTYTSFDVGTGTTPCEGYGLAYLGYPIDGDTPPRGAVSTHCFSVDGRFLQSRLSVYYYGQAHFSNLRVVSSCPCTRQIPYNTETCPPPNGSAGAPNCN